MTTMGDLMPVEAFREGERVVCLGDSTTHAGLWHYYLSYFHLCRMGKFVEFINCGVSGGNLGGALARLDKDVLFHKPNRAIISMGMNDIGRWLYNTVTPDEAKRLERQKNIDTYFQRLDQVISRLQAAGCQVILMPPVPFDEYHPVAENEKDYQCYNSQGLTPVKERLAQVARERGCSFVDIHTPMTRIYQCHTQWQLCADRVHPRHYGYLLTAVAFIEAVYGRNVTPEELLIDAATAQNPPNGVTALNFHPNGCSWIWQPEILPWVDDMVYRIGERIRPLQRLLRSIPMRVKGLPDGEYELFAGGVSCGRYHRLELENGVDLSEIPQSPLHDSSRNLYALLEEERGVDEIIRDLAVCYEIGEQENISRDDLDGLRKAMDKFLAGCAGMPWESFYSQRFESFWKNYPHLDDLYSRRRIILEAMAQSKRPAPILMRLVKR